MIVERIERRILGALRLLDPTTKLPLTQSFLIHAATLQPLANDGTPVGTSISLRPGDAKFQRNSRGDIVILSTPGFEKYTRAFNEIPTVTRAALGVEILDAKGTFLPLAATIPLPRDPDSTHSAQADSIFQPATISPFFAPSAPTEVSWSVIRATVRERLGQNNNESGGARLPWTQLVVKDAQSNTVLARGLADARGEALVAIPGILITMPANDSEAVLTREIQVKLEGAFNPHLKMISDAGVLHGENPNPQFVPSLEPATTFRPARVKASGAAVSETVQIAAGRTVIADLWLDTA